MRLCNLKFLEVPIYSEFFNLISNLNYLIVK